MRLGNYPCKIKPNTLAYEIYKEDLIYERHDIAMKLITNI